MTYFTETAAVTKTHTARPSVTQLISLWKQRRQLRTMDERTLTDLGLTRAEALAESRQPIWNVPAHWLR